MKSAFKVLQLIIFSSAIGSWQVEANASFITSRSNRRTSCLKRKNTADDDDEKTWSFNNKSLTKRIAEVQASESVFVSGLQRRLDKIVKADELDAAMSLKDENNNIIEKSTDLMKTISDKYDDLDEKVTEGFEEVRRDIKDLYKEKCGD